MTTRQWLCGAALCGTLAALTGCGGGDGRGAVSGTVTVNGEPLDFGSINLIPEGGDGPKVGTGIEGGKFLLEPKFGPQVGPHKVQIQWMKKTGKTLKHESGTDIDERVPALPEKYNEKTELKTTIQPGENKLQFDLKN